MTQRPYVFDDLADLPATPRRVGYLALVAVLVVVTLSFDLSQPLGVAAGMKYVLLVLAGLLAREVTGVWVLAVLASFLTLLGYHLSPSGVDEVIVMTNRVITLILIWAVAFAVAAVNMHRQRLYKISQVDYLTGAHNRNYLSHGLKQLVDKWVPGETPLALVVIDIDHFKLINDRYGHLAGDHVLRTIANICQTEIRQHDLFCRYGGEEFVIVLPGLDINASQAIADRLREKIENSEIVFGDATINVTASFGVTQMTPATRDYSDLFTAADEALYAAKSAGRNLVIVNVRENGDATDSNYPENRPDGSGAASATS